LRTQGATPESVRRAYRKWAKRYHPDACGGDKADFQLINEAYALLTRGTLSKRPLLADDARVARLSGKTIPPLSKSATVHGYAKWHREHFYWDW